MRDISFFVARVSSASCLERYSLFKKRLALVAIDKAHCIVEWSGSFVFCTIFIYVGMLH